MDLHATALSAAGIRDQQALKLDGVDLVPYLKDQKKGSPHEALYWRATLEEPRWIPARRRGPR